MRLVSAASLLALAGLVSADDASDVLSLTSSNFLSVVNKEPLMLVEFFAPWCGHCKNLAPQYEAAATTLKEKNIKLAKVDCVDQADLCQEHEVKGYPTLKTFRSGEPLPYTGPRQADGIVSYMIKQSLPSVAEVTIDNHEEFKTTDKMVLLAYLSSPTDAPGPEFTAAAEKHRDDYLFGYTTDPKAIEAAGVTAPAIVLYRTFDEPRIDYAKDVASIKEKDIEAFAKENKIPYVDEVHAENYQNYMDSHLPLAYLFLDPTESAKDEHISTLRDIAMKYKGKVNFVWIDGIKFGDHAKALNLHQAKWPAFVIQDLSKQLKYPLSQSEAVTGESISAHVDQYVSGKLQPELKSEPIPESQDEPVHVLVGKIFDEVVFDDSKDVFVEFYAPWCGHCKRLKPTWDSLGERYANVKDKIVIAKMDATENDLPPSVDFQVNGFPTLKFKPAGSKTFMDFNGDRSLESLIEFVEENAKNDLTYVPPPAGAQEPIEHAATPEVHDHDEL